MKLSTKRIMFDVPVDGSYAIDLQPNEKLGKLNIIGLDVKMRPRAVVSIPFTALDELQQSIWTIEKEVTSGS